MVQFHSAQVDYTKLVKSGIVLEDYLGSNPYFASVPLGKRASDFVETGMHSVAPIRPEWKVMRALQDQNYPTWAATKIVRDYTRDPLALDAKASSGLPVSIRV